MPHKSPGAMVGLALLASCHRTASVGSATEPELALAVYAAQRVVVVPTAFARMPDSLAWAQPAAGQSGRSLARQLDTSIALALESRGLASRWVLPAELTRAFHRNSTYATDPTLLDAAPLRGANFKTGERYADPLASQLRTMIALHEDARFVLFPVELRFERAPTGAKGVLKVALLDPRFTEAKWVGEVKGDVAASPATALTSVATRLADLFVAP